jgi:hypothetical protein
MKRDNTSPDLMGAIESLREVPEPDSERQATSRTLFLHRARALRWKVAAPDVAVPDRRRKAIPLMMPRRLRRFASAGLAVAMVLALVASTGAVAYAADESVPGDRLYGIDQAMEWAQLSLTSKPLATTKLLLSFAEERLLEAEALVALGDMLNLEVALDKYASTIALVAQTVGRIDSTDATALAALVDQSFSVHNDRLARILQDIGVNEGDDRATEEDEPTRCADSNPHLLAVYLAGSFGESPKQVMTWFCAGYSLGEIIHALSTGKEAGVDTGTLLARKTALGGWGLVWLELDLIGPRKEVPAGPPDDVGPPDDRPVGPPEDETGRQPQGSSVEPPEETPGIGPDGSPVAPPEDEPREEPKGKSDP